MFAFVFAFLGTYEPLKTIRHPTFRAGFNWSRAVLRSFLFFSCLISAGCVRVWVGQGQAKGKGKG